jgi:hypothetical protein
MTREQSARGTTMSRRMALRAGAALTAVGAGAVVNSRGAVHSPVRGAAAQPGPWRTLQLEFDFVGVNGVVFDRLGGLNPAGTPLEQGDHCNIAWRLHNPDQTDGEQMGEYHCFGPYTRSAMEQGQAGMDCITVARFRLAEGTIFGIVDCCPPHWEGAGAVHGGTDAYLGAFGAIRQGPVRTGIWRVAIDLYLPNFG